MDIRWQHGFFRLWLAISLLWVVGVSAVAFSDTGIPSLTKSCTMLLEFTLDSTGAKLGPSDVAKCEGVWRENRMKLGASAFGPPVGLLIFGFVFGWIAQGFRNPHKSGIV